MKLLKNKLAVTIIVLSVTFLGLIIYSASRDVKGLEGGAGSALSPIQKITYGINRGVKDFVDFFLNFSDVKAENKELVKENEKLKDELAENSDLEEENERLKDLLDFKESRDEYNYIATNIIGTKGSILEGLIIDKGKDDGIEKNMIVIGSKGLVGKVTSVANNWAIIETIVNENISVSVMLEETRENSGILEGYTNEKNEKLAKISYLPMNSEVKEGDVVLTSGYGEIYPKEIRIGEVIKVEEDKVKVMKSAIVKPYVDFDKLEELLVVAPKDTRVINYK
ncbi:MAG: rod shape-determining protein MreC [Clostridiales bacterium]|nr:rod shape-determining protein MreC [Clostridiales bacterium]